MGKKDSRRKRKLARERERLRRKAQAEEWARIQAEAADRLAQNLALDPAQPGGDRQDRYDEFRRLMAGGRMRVIEQQLADRLERQEGQIRSLHESNERLRQALAQIRAGEGTQVRFSPGLERQVQDALLDMEVEIVDD